MSSNDPWHPVQIDDWQSEEDSEPLGSRQKFWVRDAAGGRWLFKYTRRNLSGEYTSGEDWAEILATTLAQSLNVPAAVVSLAAHNGRRGTVSHSVVPRDLTLVPGNELLALFDVRYVGGHANENAGYTVAAVHRALGNAIPPLSWTGPGDFSAFDVWAGYLLLDAWMAGSDRHDQNWAVAKGAGPLRLAASFDHGNALGFQLQPEKHGRLAKDPPALERWAAKGNCRYFSGKPTLVGLAHAALGLARPSAKFYWLEKLRGVTADEIGSIFTGSRSSEASPLMRLAQSQRPLVRSYCRCQPVCSVNSY